MLIFWGILWYTLAIIYIAIAVIAVYETQSAWIGVVFAIAFIYLFGWDVITQYK